MRRRALSLRLDPDELDSIFAGLESASAIVAAVSGGPDSTALLHALGCWNSQRSRPRILVATIDHKLRPEAWAEADAVAAAAAILGLAHFRLTWRGRKPATGLQEAAREARYGLLAALAREHGASHLVTAHTLDDQAETVLMRLARGSGLAGLGGMRRQGQTRGLVHCRPFLHLPKAALVTACRDHGWPFFDDPSNADPRFARTRWRAILPQLAAEGLDARRLAKLAERAQQAEDALAAKAA